MASKSGSMRRGDYKAPMVSVYGSMSELTASGSAGAMEQDNNKGKDKKA